MTPKPVDTGGVEGGGAERLHFALALLSRLEFNDGHTHKDSCFVCGYPKHRGHEYGCSMVAVLRGEKPVRLIEMEQQYGDCVYGADLRNEDRTFRTVIVESAATTEKPTDSMGGETCPDCGAVGDEECRSTLGCRTPPTANPPPQPEKREGPYKIGDTIGRRIFMDAEVEIANAAYLAGQESTGDELASLTNQLAKARAAQPEGDELRLAAAEFIDAEKNLHKSMDYHVAHAAIKRHDDAIKALAAALGSGEGKDGVSHG